MIQRNFQIEFRKFLRIALVFLQRKSWRLNSRRSASKIARCVAGLISFKLRVEKIDYCFSFAFQPEVTQSESVLIVHLKSTTCAYQKVLFSPPGASMHMGLRPEDSIDFCRLPIGQASHVSSLCPHFPFYGFLQVSLGGLSFVGRRDSVGRRLWAGLMMAFGKCRYRVYVEGQTSYVWASFR